MKKILALVLSFSVALAAGCGKDMPQMPEGDAVIILAVADTSGSFEGSTPGEPFFIGEAEVTLQSLSHAQTITGQTTGDGEVAFRELVAGRYTVFARYEEFAGSGKLVYTGFADITIDGTEVSSDTLIVGAILTSSLMINEILYCGSDYSTFYFYDQFVELYNASNDTLYLDGCILTRNYPDDFLDMDTNDFVRAIYAFQFPGTPVTGREHPIAPGEFIVVAADAIDHSMYNDKAVDLSNADWEFFNALGSDYDNPTVPNVVSIHPDKRTDYMINLSHNAVVLANGESFGYEAYGDGKVRITLPIGTVLDGVEYASSTTVTRELTARVDAGLAGFGNSKYSGQSVERREIGLDTNNSTFDFVLTKPPTPGWSHAQGGSGK